MRLINVAVLVVILLAVSVGPVSPVAAGTDDGYRVAQKSKAAKPRERRVLRVGPDRALRTPSAAARIARNGDHVRIDPGTYRDCAVWRANDLILEGLGKPRPHMTSVVCDDQAIWLIRGNDVRVINIKFSRAHSSQFNGAGIKMVGSNLLVRKSLFHDNENGILTAGRPRSHIIVIGSRFLRNGSCVRACAHGIYAGKVYRLVVRNSIFFGQKQGHHIKSRARMTQILSNRISDGREGTASMSINLPIGGTADISYNHIEQGPKAENYKLMISIGEESIARKGRPTPFRQPSRGLIFKNNVFVNNHPRGGIFIRNLTETPLTMRGNRFIGKGIRVVGPALGRTETAK